MSEIILMVRRARVWTGIAGWALVTLITLSAAPVAAGGDLPSVAVAGFSYKDTSGEVRDQTQEHRTRLDMLNRLLRESLASDGKFAIADIACRSAECAVEDGVAPPALIESAAKSGARYLVVGGVQKMSTLVQWARVSVLDLESRKAVLDRLYTFRGDTEDAWRHAALFVARQVNELRLTD